MSILPFHRRPAPEKTVSDSSTHSREMYNYVLERLLQGSATGEEMRSALASTLACIARSTGDDSLDATVAELRAAARQLQTRPAVLKPVLGRELA